MRHQAVQRALQLADVRRRAPCQLLEDPGRESHAAVAALAPEDRHARLVVGDADVDDESPGEARDQALVHVGDLGGRSIAGHHDLPSAPLQRVEDAQHLALRLHAPGEELHIIEEEEADTGIAPLEGIGLSGGDRLVQL